MHILVILKVVANIGDLQTKRTAEIEARVNDALSTKIKIYGNIGFI